MFELVPFDYAVRHAVPFSPFKEFDGLFNSPSSKFMSGPFSTDVIDNGSSYELNAELPGFNKDDIKLNVENDCLTISAERKVEEDNSTKNFVKRERFYGSYTRSFDLTGIDIDKIEASYNDGVLTLNLPKIPEAVPVSKSITIN